MSVLLLLAAVSLVMLPIAARVMRILAGRWRLERENFRKESIPTAYGFVIVMVAVPVLLVHLAVFSAPSSSEVFLIGILVFGLIGLIDDIYGSRDVGGFSGHLGLLRKGRVTTGLAKAVIGGLTGLALGAFAAGFRPVESIVNGLLIGLSANLLNLLDLRPGRAVSCFWLGIVLLVVTKLGRLSVWPELIPVCAAALWLTWLDRSAKIMLGDAGSNALGAALGLALVYDLGLASKTVLVVLVLAVHLYSEKRSISGLIERNRVLRAVDGLLGER